MLDIIITTYNRIDHLKRTLESFFAHTDLSLVHNIIIANDGSTDGTDKYLVEVATTYPQVQIIADQVTRKGLIPRFNEAYSRTVGDVICEFQDDVQFSPGWLEAQLKALKENPDCHFVSGYDGPEHRAFSQTEGGHDIKHSNGFVQLLAYRRTWDQWFPMTPRSSFPTPCVRGGKPVGSGIDTGIYHVKNRPGGGVRYVIVPSVVHTAHLTGSSWRPPLSANHRTNRPRFGGLPKGLAKHYWQQRCKREGPIAVGYAGRPLEEQQWILAEKQAFIRPHLRPDLFTVDYGCGVGLFSPLFTADRYVGMDLTSEFLEVAAKRNPSHNYLVVPPCLDHNGETALAGTRIEQFMTTNVLQHNDDSTVLTIFKNLRRLLPDGGARLVLYENSESAPDSKHMRFRRASDYVAMVGESFLVRSSYNESHVVHGERHTLTVIEV